MTDNTGVGKTEGLAKTWDQWKTVVQPSADAPDQHSQYMEGVILRVFKERRGPCTMGVGCDESGVCYAEAHGEPERCEETKVIISGPA